MRGKKCSHGIKKKKEEGMRLFLAKSDRESKVVIAKTHEPHSLQSSRAMIPSFIVCLGTSQPTACSRLMDCPDTR